jgi:hypothetical protein
MDRVLHMRALHMTQEELAKEELKLIQDAIFKEEEYCYSAYRYAFVIISGLALGLFSTNVAIGTVQFLVVSLLVLSGSIYLQLIYRESFYGAVARSYEIQKFLRKEIANYNGPRLYEALHQLSPSRNAVLEALKNPRFSIPNAFLIGLVVLSAIVKIYSC